MSIEHRQLYYWFLLDRGELKRVGNSVFLLRIDCYGEGDWRLCKTDSILGRWSVI